MTENNPIPPTPSTTTPPVSTDMTTGYPGPYVGPEPTSDAKTMALLCHLLNIIFLVPLLVWVLKKEQHPFIADQSKEALNFSLCCLIIHIICSVTAFLCIPALIALALVITQIVLGIMGAMAANKGVAYRYPLNFRFIK
jgi:uncharacterized Tic20 family protein